MDTATFVKDKDNRVIIVLSGKEAKIVVEALEHYARLNKRKQPLQRLSKEFIDKVECY